MHHADLAPRVSLVGLSWVRIMAEAAAAPLRRVMALAENADSTVRKKVKREFEQLELGEEFLIRPQRPPLLLCSRPT